MKRIIAEAPALVLGTLGGALAGALAGAVYPFASGYFLPNINTELVLPEGSLHRAIWLGIAAGLLGLTIPGLAAAPKPPAAEPTPR